MTSKPHSVQQNNYKFHTATKINLYRNSSAVATIFDGLKFVAVALLRSRQSKIAIIVKINSNWKYYIIWKLWELEFIENLNTTSNVKTFKY